MPGALKLSFWDYDKENSTVVVPFEISAANWVLGQDDLDDLRAAINGVTTCVNWKEERSQMIDLIPGTPPDDPTCHRELKWLVRMTEATSGRNLKMEIPGPEFTLLNPTNKGKMLITSGAGKTLVDQIELVYRSDRNLAVTVNEIELVGRNV